METGDPAADTQTDHSFVCFFSPLLAKDGHKEKTLGTAEIDMAQLCSTPKSISRIAVQFAAKSQGKLKTKATMLIASQWLKVGGEKYIAPPEEEGSTPSLDLTSAEDQLFAAHTMMSARSSTGDDGSVSELSESTTPGDEENEESNVIFDSEDLDRTARDGVTSIDYASGRVSRESDLSRNSVTSTATTDTRASNNAPASRTLTKQNSHPELNSAKISSNSSYSASMSGLPELILPPSGTGAPGPQTATSRARTKSSAPAMSQRAGTVTSSNMTTSRPSLSQQAVSSSAPQAIIRPPVESSPYVSYVDNDGPELPDSAQSTLVYLAPNAFAIQTAAISGDEIAKLRAENMDKNLKLSLLGKQVSVLEKKLSDATTQVEETTKKEKELNAEVATLSKRVRRLRKHAKAGLSDSTLDESASTSSGGAEGSKDSGSGKKRRRKEKEGEETQVAKRVFWTPEEERRGLVLLFAIAMLAVLFFCSPAFQSTLYSIVDALGFGSSSSSNTNSTELAVPGANAVSTDSSSANLFTSAANEFSSAFASALNITNEVEAPT